MFLFEKKKKTVEFLSLGYYESSIIATYLAIHDSKKIAHKSFFERENTVCFVVKFAAP